MVLVAGPGHQPDRVPARLRRAGGRRRRQRHPELPGVRGPRLLRQRRPPALRGPGLPVRGRRQQRDRRGGQLRRPTGRATRSWPPGGPAGRAAPARRSASGSPSSAARTCWCPARPASRLVGVSPGAAVELFADADATLNAATNTPPGAVRDRRPRHRDQHPRAIATRPAPGWIPSARSPG